MKPNAQCLELNFLLELEVFVFVSAEEDKHTERYFSQGAPSVCSVSAGVSLLRLKRFKKGGAKIDASVFHRRQV